MESINYYKLTENLRSKFYDFLKECSNETDHPAHKNMWQDDWETKKNTLPYLLEKTDRFRIGGFYQILFESEDVIACSGVYTSYFCKDLAILGTRTWVHKDHRHRLIVRDHLLPVEKAWAIREGYKAVALTFNEYNKNLIKLWRRMRLGENRPKIQPHNFGFKSQIVEFPVEIQYTKQWVIYEKLDETFEFDWNSIRYKE